MKNVITTVATLTILGSSISQAAGVLIQDFDFSSGSVVANDTRLRLGDADGGFNAATGTLWEIAGGELTNAGTGTGNFSSQGGVLSLSDLQTTDYSSYDTLTISFDYNVAAGNTLYLHFTALYNGTSTAANTQLFNTGVNSGSIQSQYDSSGDFNAINLINGALTPNGATSGAQALNGSGTYSQTIVLGTGAYAAFASVDDFKYIMGGFSANVDDGTHGDMSIDNFSIEADAVPEPSSTALLGLGGLALILRRRK